MKILRNYILEEVFTSFFAVLFFLTFILMVGNVFASMIDLVMNRGVDILRITQVIVHSLPFLMMFTIPTAALVAILLTFGRLSADHELVAMRASGINLRRIFKPILITAFCLSLFTFYLSDQIAPRSHFKVRQIASEIGLETPAAILEEGVFIKSFKGFVIFIHRIEGNVLKQIRIYQPQKDGPTRTIIAERGELIPLPEQNIIKLKLTNGTSDEPDSSNPGRFYKLNFGTYFLPLDISTMKFKGTLDRKRKERSITELWAHYSKLTKEGFYDAYALTEINKRVAAALSSFCFAMIGIPLAIRTQRGEKSIGFAIALILVTIYWVALIGMASLGKKEVLSPWIALHIPNIIYVLLGCVLMRKNLKA